ncbi:MAG: hypothetical protein FJ387_00540 [Verrucomicrobia bacterium]|nr:hypothetical protein [Verrucomicrobiota bacterium]
MAVTSEMAEPGRGGPATLSVPLPDVVQLELQAAPAAWERRTGSVRLSSVGSSPKGSWDPRFGGSAVDGAVYALASDGTNVWVGGEFVSIGGLDVNNVAVWDGNRWAALSSGTAGPVYALALEGTNLIAGGEFVRASGVAATNIAKWNGVRWTGLDTGVDGPVYALGGGGGRCMRAASSPMPAIPTRKT